MRSLFPPSFLVFLCTLATGQSVPPLINYQGRLTDQTGAALAPGAYTIQFRLWDSSTNSGATDLIWGQQQSVTVASNGMFNVILGSGSPIPSATPSVNNLAYAFAGTNCFLGVTVVSSNGATNLPTSEIAPRQQLLSAPFAIHSDDGNPPGTIVAYGGENVPAGWLFCDGTAYPTNAYPQLWAAISRAWGAVADPTTFRVPDLRGIFPRGWNHGSTNDPDATTRFAWNYSAGVGGATGDNVGTYQSSTNLAHNHGGTSVPAPGVANVMPACNQTLPNYALNYFSTTDPFEAVEFTAGGATLASQLAIRSDGGREARPINASVAYIIKY